jgi:hypothetical protein
MNPDNYGSLEACQRLIEAGIMVETEVVWKWIERDKIFMLASKDTVYTQDFIPALSMAEAFREVMKHLPKTKYIRIGYREENREELYLDVSFMADSGFHSKNPTDCLINLKIWLEGGRKKYETSNCNGLG